jgi:hypothetical protein
MGQRSSRILWLRDILEHLRQCQQQLQWAENPETIRILTDAMIRDLDDCRRLCEDVGHAVQRRRVA